MEPKLSATSNVKQVICMRTDLNMRKGKMIAQGAHASIAFLTHAMQEGCVGNTPDGPFEYSEVIVRPEQQAWIEGRFTKICVRVDSEKELLEIKNAADEAGVVCHLIQDAGLTEFKDSSGDPLPTYTCLALGPDYSERIDSITKHLTLL